MTAFGDDLPGGTWRIIPGYQSSPVRFLGYSAAFPGGTWTIIAGDKTLDCTVDGDDVLAPSWGADDTQAILRQTWYLLNSLRDQPILGGSFIAAKVGTTTLTTVGLVIEDEVVVGIELGERVYTVAGISPDADGDIPAEDLAEAVGGGVTVHNNLTGRGAADAHPMSAITGLPAALAELDGPVFTFTDGDDWSDLLDTLGSIDGPKSLQFLDDWTEIPAGTWDLNGTTLVGRGVYGAGTGGTVVECGEGVHLTGLGTVAAQGGIVLYSTATTHPIVEIDDPCTVVLSDDAAVCSASAAFFHVDQTTPGNVVFSIRYGSGIVLPSSISLPGGYEAIDVDALDNPSFLVILVDPTVGNSVTDDNVIRGSGGVYRFVFSAATLAAFGMPSTKGDTQTNLTGGVTVLRAETASRMFFDNSTSSLDASQVQAAIEEAVGRIDDLEAGGGGVSSVNGETGAVTLDKSDVGLGNVDDVSAANLRDRSTHTGTQTASTISDFATAAAAAAPWKTVSSQTVTGSAAAQIDVDLTAVAGATMWRARFVGRADPTGSASVGLRARFNSDSGNNYSTGGAAAASSIVLGNVTASQTNTDRASTHDIAWGHISGHWTLGSDSNVTPNSNGSTAPAPNTQGWAWMVTTDPTSFSLFPASGSFVVGTRLVVEAR